MAKAQKDRSFILYQLKQGLLDNFYTEQNRIKEEALQDIAYKNWRLLSCATPTFLFEGKWYSYGYEINPKNTKGVNRVLHPSLKESVNFLVHHKEFEDVEIKAEISNFIGNILTECSHEYDLRYLLPHEFSFTFLCYDDAQIFNIADPMGQATVARIKEQNAAGYRCLGRIKLTKLLLSNT